MKNNKICVAALFILSILIQCVHAQVAPNSSTPTRPVVAVKRGSFSLSISGATQNGVTGSKNWAAVKGSGGYVTVTAVFNPPNSTATVSWVGGTAIVGQPRQRRISKSLSGKFNVKATSGRTQMDVDIWVIWATITVKMDGEKPQNAIGWKANEADGTQSLGAVYNNPWVEGLRAPIGNFAWGKVIPIGKIEPAGVNKIITRGWSFPQDAMGHDFKDGVRAADSWDANWLPDPLAQDVLTPDANDQIYTGDSPNLTGGGATDTQERNLNLRLRVKWNGTPCSDYAYWHWKGHWERNASPRVRLKEVGPGLINPLPNENEGFYPPPQ